MTFENAVKKIKAKFEEVDASKLADMAVQVTLTDEDCGGTLYFKVADGKVDVEGYDYRDNDAVIDIDRKTFGDILSGKLTLDKAIEKGLATAKGNFEKLATLNDAIPKYVPAKKTKAEPVAENAKEEVKAETKPVTVKAEAKPVEVKAEAKPVAVKVEAKPVEVKAEAKPVAAKPAAVKTAAKPVSKTTAAKKKTVKK